MRLLYPVYRIAMRKTTVQGMLPFGNTLKTAVNIVNSGNQYYHTNKMQFSSFFSLDL